MNRPTVRLGPAAVLLTVIAICLAILAILTFTTARADLRLAEKYADTVRARYALESEGQKYLADLAAEPGTAPPADADGVIRLTSARPLTEGTFVQARLTGADTYDLTGEVI